MYYPNHCFFVNQIKLHINKRGEKNKPCKNIFHQYNVLKYNYI